MRRRAELETKAQFVLFDTLTFLKRFMLHDSLRMQPNKYTKCGGGAEFASARKRLLLLLLLLRLLFFLKASSLSFSVVLIQVNCLLCIINFLLFPSLFLSHHF